MASTLKEFSNLNVEIIHDALSPLALLSVRMTASDDSLKPLALASDGILRRRPPRPNVAGSPHRHNGIEAGSSWSGDFDDEDGSSDPFDITDIAQRMLPLNA
ncbi:uncharacterized protein G2W53_015616 [Senna tora]|uniref:Uncharacterized protein n=1 Tax=Senna tora TaxID=362788 RepID=A0A834WVU1_9FABA|nr:uncharacterized protein G2W53_015616 [Senna tora]